MAYRERCTDNPFKFVHFENLMRRTIFYLNMLAGRTSFFSLMLFPRDGVLGSNAMKTD